VAPIFQFDLVQTEAQSIEQVAPIESNGDRPALDHRIVSGWGST
jgi:hypothetical protein